MKAKLILATLLLAVTTPGLANDLKVPGGTVRLDQAALLRSGIQAAPLSRATHQQTIQAYGVVLSAQSLLDLRNRVVMSRSQMDKARATQEISRQEYLRIKSLHDDGRNVSDKALQAAEGAWRIDQASSNAAGEALDAVISDARLQWGNAIVRAVLDNAPLFRQLVDGREALIQITALSGVTIPEAPPTAEIQANGKRVVKASLVSPSPKTDPKFQGLSFFFHAPSSGLLPGMTVTASLPVGLPKGGVVIPASAVVSKQGSAWVYVPQEPGSFVRRKLLTDTPVAGGWFASRGFEPDEMVVTTGAQQLLSQEFHARIQSGDDEGDQD
ncbi:MAG: efflux RND transporter periplasmic adaptor subunit [Burkholderiales bacterium]|nr:hypothetical protein [Burkholderiales bacterium]